MSRGNYYSFENFFDSPQAKQKYSLPDKPPHGPAFLCQEYVDICKEMQRLFNLHKLNPHNEIIKQTLENLRALKTQKAQEIAELYFNYDDLFGEKAAEFNLTQKNWIDSFRAMLSAENSIEKYIRNAEFISFLELEISYAAPQEEMPMAIEHQEDGGLEFLANKLALFNVGKDAAGENPISNLLNFIQQKDPRIDEDLGAIADELQRFFPSDYDTEINKKSFCQHFLTQAIPAQLHYVRLIASTCLVHCFGFTQDLDPQKNIIIYAPNLGNPHLNHNWTLEGSDANLFYKRILQILEDCNMADFKSAIEAAANIALQQAIPSVAAASARAYRAKRAKNNDDLSQ